MLTTALLLLLCGSAAASDGPVRAAPGSRLVPIGEGWAANSVNAVIFRQSAVTTFNDTQYAAYYDQQGRVVLAKRTLGSGEWRTRVTRYTGNIRDAHCSISIGVDGNGVLHVSWGHHGNPLNYARSIYPGSLMLTDRLPMTGKRESRVTYPEFFRLASGDLVFLYRDGASGAGDTLLDYWDCRKREWRPLQHALINGEGQRNAYTNQIAIDSKGVWHLTWCWRETGDVATNHDLCYARSADQGRTWTKSNGDRYALPITQATAEVICPIPQKSNLINTTTTAVDSRGRPMLATYWSSEPSGVPQYNLVWFDGKAWRVSRIGERREGFSLSGGGTRRIRCSRPKLAVDSHDRLYLIFRDSERDHRVSVAISDDPQHKDWRITDLTANSVGLWEPNYDTELWNRDGILHIFVERTEQGDGETLGNLGPQEVSVLEWAPQT